jgi:hypothetical protein
MKIDRHAHVATHARVRAGRFAPLAALVATVGIAFAAACGGGQPEAAVPTAPPPPATAPEAVPTSPAPPPVAEAVDAGAPSTAAEPPAPAAPTGKPWPTLSREERLAVMKKEVMPKMAAAFKEQDPVKYKDFNCATCHGARIKQGNFAMPNPLLPKLNAKDDFKKHAAKTPAMLKFMETHVEPEMASMLGLPAYDMKTHTGFGCGDCHLFEK